MKRWMTVLVLPLLAPGVGAQDPALPEGHSVHGEAFNEGPRQRAYLMEGTGKVRLEVTTKDPRAQAFFTQGVGQLHSFWYFEAERSFRQAAALDPECAMAYWGMAMANVNNEKRAKSFIEKAEKLKDKAGRREQLWIAALADYHRQTDRDRKNRGFIGALENIIHEFPDEIEAKAFLAWAMWHLNGKGLAITSHQAVDSLIGDVLRDNPMHPGAHHYRIHLWDSQKSARAVPSAELFGFSAPGIAHAWHMCGHIWSKLQRYGDAARWQEASSRVDHAHMFRDRVMPYQIHNYAHNQQWLITDLSHVGRVKEAVALAENMIEIPRHPRLNRLEDGGSCARYGRTRLLEILDRWELWEELTARAETHLAPISPADDRPRRLRALGRAYLALGDLVKGRRVIAELEGAPVPPPGGAGDAPKPEYPEGAPAPPAEKPKAEPPKQEDEKTREARSRPLRAAIADLKGHLASAEKDYDAAVEHFEKAGDVQKEVMARAYLRAGKNEQAEKAARAAADGAKGQVHPLASLAEVLLSIGKKEDAAKVLRQLEDLAVEADADLPIFRRLAALEAPVARKGAASAAPKSPPQEKLGPLVWKPSVAPLWTLADGDGKQFSLEACFDGPVLVLFYLGSKCKHCVEQLDKFSAAADSFAKAGIRILTVSTETPEEIRRACEAKKDAAYPFPLLADPTRAAFKAFRCFDDFEDAPLHGTFLVDGRSGQARIRWQDISYTPFMEADFLLGEGRRLLTLMDR